MELFIGSSIWKMKSCFRFDDAEDSSDEYVIWSLHRASPRSLKNRSSVAATAWSECERSSSVARCWASPSCRFDAASLARLLDTSPTDRYERGWLWRAWPSHTRLDNWHPSVAHWHTRRFACARGRSRTKSTADWPFCRQMTRIHRLPDSWPACQPLALLPFEPRPWWWPRPCWGWFAALLKCHECQKHSSSSATPVGELPADSRDKCSR